MLKQQIRQKVSCTLTIVVLFMMPVLFMACAKEPAPAVAHFSLDSNQQQETSLEKEVRTVMEKGISLDERKRQVPVIEIAFARHTSQERARNLAALCYLKTLGTPFTPLDMAEIALAETGGHKLSSKATSTKGAIGVWQLMPNQARSHGYTPAEMRNDERNAEAAVRTLRQKLDMADGNLDRAKKLYCGVGPQAEAYLKKLKTIRRDLKAELARAGERVAQNDRGTTIQ